MQDMARVKQRMDRDSQAYLQAFEDLRRGFKEGVAEFRSECNALRADKISLHCATLGVAAAEAPTATPCVQHLKFENT